MRPSPKVPLISVPPRIYANSSSKDNFLAASNGMPPKTPCPSFSNALLTLRLLIALRIKSNTLVIPPPLRAAAASVSSFIPRRIRSFATSEGNRLWNRFLPPPCAIASPTEGTPARNDAGSTAPFAFLATLKSLNLSKAKRPARLNPLPVYLALLTSAPGVALAAALSSGPTKGTAAEKAALAKFCCNLPISGALPNPLPLKYPIHLPNKLYKTPLLSGLAFMSASLSPGIKFKLAKNESIRAEARLPVAVPKPCRLISLK